MLFSPDLIPECIVANSFISMTSVSCGFPSVNVPVLSNIATEILFSSSIASPPLNITPFDAPLLIPTIIAVGVARPRAHGQATTSTATAGIIAALTTPCAITKYQTRKVDRATIMTAYAKYPAILSTNFWRMGFLPIASSTSLTTCDKNESEPTLVAFIRSIPSRLIVPPTTLSPTFFVTGIDSPVIMDSSTADVPTTT